MLSLKWFQNGQKIVNKMLKRKYKVCKIKTQCLRIHTCIIQASKCKKGISTNVKIEATSELRKGLWLEWDRPLGWLAKFYSWPLWSDGYKGVLFIVIHQAIHFFCVTFCIFILFYEEKQMKNQKRKIWFCSDFQDLLFYEYQKPVLEFKSDYLTLCS